MIAKNDDQNDSMLTLDKVSYRVGDKQLLRDISMNIYPNETVSLIGPNGAGKSTLVKLILGLIKPTSGKIQSHAKNVGYVPQKFSVPSILPLRVMDLLAQSKAKQLCTEEKSTLYDTLSIAPLLDKQLHHLSGGEMQRVLMARAFLDKPQLLILDEPMQGLDPDSENWLYHFLDNLPVFLQCSLLVVSHDLHWVMKGSKRVICLNKHICCQGKPSQVAITPEFVQLFGHYAPYFHQHNQCNHQATCQHSTHKEHP